MQFVRYTPLFQTAVFFSKVLVIKCAVRLKYASCVTEDHRSVVQLINFSGFIKSDTLECTFLNIVGMSLSDKYLLEGRV